MKQKRINSRKRKCGKEQTAEECIGGFEGFLNKVQFNFLQPARDDGVDGREPLWGRFPLEKRYNMDQVHLPFVNSQYDTFTIEDYNHINVKCPKESL